MSPRFGSTMLLNQARSHVAKWVDGENYREVQKKHIA